MLEPDRRAAWAATFVTFAIGVVGAALAHAAAAPAWVLTGPALLVSLAGLAGLPLRMPAPVRDGALIVLGMGIGAGFDPEAGSALLRWPLAFAALAITLAMTMIASRVILERAFGFDRRSAVLAATPGHLSFVLGLAVDLRCDMGRIAVVQSIRLLALTLTVPYVALLMGFDMGTVIVAGGPPMTLSALAALVVAGLGLGIAFRRAGLPAPLLLGAMAASAAGHVTGLTPGSVPVPLMTPAFLILGILIGTRFAGLSRNALRSSLAAGLAATGIAVTLASIAALAVAAAIGMPPAHVLAAFAPGGLETMVALGATMGASPGFVAACHVARLLLLSVWVPLALRRRPA